MALGGIGSSSSGSMAAGRSADRSSVSGYSGTRSSPSSSSMAAGRSIDRSSVAGYSGTSSFSSGSMAAGRAADRASVAGYSGRSVSSPGSMAAARSADRSSVAGYSGRSSFDSMAAGRALDRASVSGYSGRTIAGPGSMAAARAADRASMPGYDLSRGAKGDRVRELQQTMKNAGFNPGKIDGVFGKRTEKALRDYQRSLGLGGRTTNARSSKDLVGNINAVEKTMPGTGNCAKAVNRAILATTGVRIYGHANQLKNTIQKAGFREVNMSLEDALKTPGLVLTWDRTNTRAGSKYGHTAITTGDGTTSVSDYVESNTLAATDRMNRQGLHVFERVH